jgi:DNA-directed RNA polymerase specialized sigma subunit
VELFINQDYVSQREVSLAPFLFDVMDSDIKSFFLEITSERQMSPKEKQKLQRRFHLTESQLTVIDLIFWQKKSQVEGGKNLGITQSGISRIIQAAKRKIHKRLRIKGNGK